ncbi:MAG: transporter [Bacteroidales bacterium]|nr:transporter [Bacteroidales bacterium]
MKRIKTVVIFLLVAIALSAQDLDFTADRPGVSTGPATVGRNVIQWEQGVQYDGDGGCGQFTFSNTLFRYGLFDGVELRLGGDAFIYNDGDKWKPAFAGLIIGTKIRCYEGKKAIPAISLLTNLALPQTGNKGFVVERLAPSVYLLFENTVNNWMNIGYNVGAEWDGKQATPSAFVALCLGFSINDRLGCFVESYNNFARYGNNYGLDLGLNYMVAEQVQLDVAANIDACNPSECWAVSIGFVWQINNPSK